MYSKPPVGRTLWSLDTFGTYRTYVGSQHHAKDAQFLPPNIYSRPFGGVRVLPKPIQPVPSRVPSLGFYDHGHRYCVHLPFLQDSNNDMPFVLWQCSSRAKLRRISGTAWSRWIEDCIDRFTIIDFGATSLPHLSARLKRRGHTIGYSSGEHNISARTAILAARASRYVDSMSVWVKHSHLNANNSYPNNRHHQHQHQIPPRKRFLLHLDAFLRQDSLPQQTC